MFNLILLDLNTTYTIKGSKGNMGDYGQKGEKGIPGDYGQPVRKNRYNLIFSIKY